MKISTITDRVENFQSEKITVKNLRIIRDNKGIFTPALTDLSKIFDFIHYNLLRDELSACDFARKSLIFNSLLIFNWTQKTRIGCAFNNYLNILLFGVPSDPF